MGCNCGHKETKPIPQVVSNTNTVKHYSCTTNNDCACKENHTAVVMQEAYTTVVCSDSGWAMPNVNDSVQLHLKNVLNLLPGAVLYNKSVGFLEVTSYDRDSGYVLTLNKGADDNAEPGTVFPSGVCFHVGVPAQCDCNSDYTGACLNADFTSPATGDTATMAVTNVSNLFVGDTISVSGYMYRIVEVLDINNIVVRNEGFGAPLGTVIKNDPHCTGKPCTVKVEVVNSDDPCTKDAVHEASSIVVCKDGFQQPLTGTADGQIAIWKNNKWNLITTNIEDVCSYTTSCLILDPNVTSYILYLADVTKFTVGGVFLIGNHTFTVTEQNTTNKYVRATISQAPTAVETIEANTTVCLDDGGCNLPNWCSVISNNKNTLDSTVRSQTWRPYSLAHLTGTYNHTFTFTAGHALEAGNKSATFNTGGISISDFIGGPVPPGASTLTISGTMVFTFKGAVHCDTHHVTCDGYSVVVRSFNTEVKFNVGLYKNSVAQSTSEYTKKYEANFQGTDRTISGSSNNISITTAEQFILPVALTVSLTDNISASAVFTCVNANAGGGTQITEVIHPRKVTNPALEIIAGLTWSLA